ncbi:MAG: hypothetical protein NVS4B8_13610 [Herpetosiphon sp.]
MCESYQATMRFAGSVSDAFMILRRAIMELPATEITYEEPARGIITAVVGLPEQRLQRTLEIRLDAVYGGEVSVTIVGSTRVHWGNQGNNQNLVSYLFLQVAGSLPWRRPAPMRQFLNNGSTMG